MSADSKTEPPQQQPRDHAATGTARATAAGLPRRVSIGLAVLAATSLEATSLHLSGPADVAAFVAAVMAATVAVTMTAAAALRFRGSLGTTPRSRLLWAVGAMLMVTAGELIARSLVDQPLPADRLLMVLLRNLTLALAVLSHHTDAQRLACMLSMFLMVFASAMAEVAWIQLLVILFAVGGVWWLMGSYWETLEERLTASTANSLPSRWLILLPVAILAVLLLLPAAGYEIHSLEGFMPSSGGRRWNQDWATSGVGDGDQLVAGFENIKSFAPLEEAPFLASHEPTLYDVFDDNFNEPIRKRKQDRAVSLPNTETVRQEDPSVSTVQRASREFSVVRKPGRRDGNRAAGLSSAAMFHVRGRVPLHLKLESFREFDGVEWSPEPSENDPPALTIEQIAGKPWLRPRLVSGFGIHAAAELHGLRVVHVDTNRIPSTNQLVGIHIDDVAQADFFRWAQPGIIALDRDRLPELLSITLQTRVVDSRSLRALPNGFLSGNISYRQQDELPRSAEVKALCERWVADLPRGWRQVERIVEKIREECVLDPEARASAETTNAVAEFLLDSHRGPNYLFASAAVQALRSLGYAARLAGGFYVDPRRTDVRSGHTSVLAADAHLWAEVSLGGDDWVTVDPTPGYMVLGPPLTLLDRLASLLWLIVATVTAYPLISLAGVVILIATWLLRKPIADRCERIFWLVHQRNQGTATAALVTLLDHRCGRAGLLRPQGVSPPRWLEMIAEEASELGHQSGQQLNGRGLQTGKKRMEAATIQPFIRVAEEALYRPGGVAVLAGTPLREACLEAERIWNWNRLRAVARERNRIRTRRRISA